MAYLFAKCEILRFLDAVFSCPMNETISGLILDSYASSNRRGERGGVGGCEVMLPYGAITCNWKWLCKCFSEKRAVKMMAGTPLKRANSLKRIYVLWGHIQTAVCFYTVVETLFSLGLYRMHNFDSRRFSTATGRCPYPDIAPTLLSSWQIMEQTAASRAEAPNDIALPFKGPSQPCSNAHGEFGELFSAACGQHGTHHYPYPVDHRSQVLSRRHSWRCAGKVLGAPSIFVRGLAKY